MAGSDEEGSEDEGQGRRPEWVGAAEEALARARDAVKAAWEASEDGRTKAFEAARSAVGQLGDAIDRGTEAAKARFGTGSADGAHAEEGAADEGAADEGAADEGAADEGAAGDSPTAADEDDDGA